MDYTHLSLRQFRSYAQYEVDFSPGVTIIIGPNGSGKTNLLEAVYMLSQGVSFRAGDRDVMRYGQRQFRLQGEYGGSMRRLNYDADKTPPKTIRLDGVEKKWLSHQQKVPLVLFEPEDLRLVSGSPQRRRDYLDGLISRLWPEAGRWRGRYERALQQRNSILKQALERPSGSFDDQFFIWDIKLVEYAALLVTQRQKMLGCWNAQMGGLYSAIAGKPTGAAVSYQSETALDNYKANLLQQLHSHRQRDIARGFTGIGPHRDDFRIFLNDADASVSASRGEVRTLLLTLKMIELGLLDSLSPRRPLLLLDDVFSELDVPRRSALARLATGRQTIITTTDADSLAGYFTGDYRIIKTG